MNLPVPAVTIGLLILSNLFMTVAWYGHLKFKAAPLLLVILVSWGIAFFEYVLQVPANRSGYGHFSAAQLKTIQEVISLSIFVLFSWLWLGERLTWNIGLGFGFICFGAFLIFHRFGAAPN
ncbi:DMT family protein [Paracoccus sp. MA]|uniref:DMT family protein n=1 Tax=Paracoccus sp. MA TaxID=2895796 RepID=UPI001E4948DB|nr:DMT family protein [Paracoccus sp. MA]UFM63867.1 DMT family protein [Paracoccus sp. MA]